MQMGAERVGLSLIPSNALEKTSVYLHFPSPSLLQMFKSRFGEGLGDVRRCEVQIPGVLPVPAGSCPRSRGCHGGVKGSGQNQARANLGIFCRICTSSLAGFASAHLNSSPWDEEQEGAAVCGFSGSSSPAPGEPSPSLWGHKLKVKVKAAWAGLCWAQLPHGDFVSNSKLGVCRLHRKLSPEQGGEDVPKRPS